VLKVALIQAIAGIGKQSIEHTMISGEDKAVSPRRHKCTKIRSVIKMPREELKQVLEMIQVR
jgi:hypothetical protein